MVIWSSVARPAAATTMAMYRGVLQTPACKNALQVQFRKMAGGGHDHHHMHIQPTRFQWNKFKDLFHFYTFLGLIPVTAIVLFANIFIGPSELTETPEDYEPKHWEYYRHPITRFIARYIYPNPQQEYEKRLHYLFEENEKAQLRKLENEIRARMAERKDYQAYYYRPAIAKYHRISKEASDHLESIFGD